MRDLHRSLILAAIVSTATAVAVLVPADSRRASPATVDGPRAEKDFIAILDARGPAAALAELRRMVEADPAVAGECHGIAHDLGHEAYERAGGFAEALRASDEICNSGYFHGIIEAHFASVDDIGAAMRTVCGDLDPRRYLGWECYHGVGHGLMYDSENDVSASLTRCRDYADAAARRACVNGVYMELFNAGGPHPSSLLDPSDPSSPCATADADVRGECHLYAPAYFLHLHPRQYAEALRRCRAVEAPYRDICLKGVGAQAFKEHPSEPAIAEAACRSGTPEEAETCIRGLATGAVFHHGAMEPVERLCASLAPASRMTCRAAAAANAGLFLEGP